MRQIIEISPATLKRLQNYQRVAENDMMRARKAQWIEMTLDRMQAYLSARQKSDHIGAVAAYADFLFRVQNNQMPYRKLHGEHLLRNALVALLGELHIPVAMVDVPREENVHVNSSGTPTSHP